jgi:NAD(P)-dependent dehydrogenase (short-subunit alcohol dehydrogenase family)
MDVVVVTGSTRGIGYGLAEAFLDLGCAVVVNGRSRESVDRAVVRLAEVYDGGRVIGHPADVGHYAAVQGLWDAAVGRFDRVDIWINNAGLGNPQLDFWEHPPARIESVVSANVLGAMFGARIALRGMLDQGGGSLYNMEGLGSDGRTVPGLTLYGTTKAGLRYFTDGLIAETRETPVRVGAISPGMVVTDLLTGQYEKDSEAWRRARRIFNILADRVETVAPWVARKVLANREHGARIRWLTTPKVIWRFASSPFHDRDVISS